MHAGRVIFLMMDSLGVGASHDAASYGDVGANTFVHIVHSCRDGRADKKDLRQGPLTIPHLARLGLYHAASSSAGEACIDLSTLKKPDALYGYAVEKSLGKDTPSGHWEMMGVPVLFPWGYFPDQPACFPPSLIEDFIRETGVPGILGNKHASGTEIIQEYGAEHQATGKPIVYTSGDSVFQIAAHEETFGLDKLYNLCLKARALVDDYHVGRVIARPFLGTKGSYVRTAHRRDYATPPPAPTLLDKLYAAGREVIAIGKIADIFAHQGITKTVKADGNMALFDATLLELQHAPAGSLVFTNFVDFDSSFGHRRDLPGYAHALEEFDARWPELEALLHPHDLVVISADHGCDPTFPGSDHTREHVPVLVYAPGMQGRDIGQRDTFADVGQSLAQHLGIKALDHGVSFLI